MQASRRGPVSCVAVDAPITVRVYAQICYTHKNGSEPQNREREMGGNEEFQIMNQKTALVSHCPSLRQQPLLHLRQGTRPGNVFHDRAIKHGNNVHPRQEWALASRNGAKYHPEIEEEVEQQHEVA
jgi:hypothetical protein